MATLTPFAPCPPALDVGNVYLVRGWVGIFSGGMDHLDGEINQSGVNSLIFQHDQCKELAKTMVDRYKNAKNPEPICMVGHSFGSDDALIIARELDKAGVPVDLIIMLDAVNEKTVPKNVKLCYNFWQPGMFGRSNFLRGIPLTQEPGGTGRAAQHQPAGRRPRPARRRHQPHQHRRRPEASQGDHRACPGDLPGPARSGSRCTRPTSRRGECWRAQQQPADSSPATPAKCAGRRHRWSNLTVRPVNPGVVDADAGRIHDSPAAGTGLLALSISRITLPVGPRCWWG